MADSLLLATQTGLVLAERAPGGWREVRRALAGQPLTSVIAREGVILVGSRAGVQRSDDLLGEAVRLAAAGARAHGSQPCCAASVTSAHANASQARPHSADLSQ